jgi:hypothetical protein
MERLEQRKAELSAAHQSSASSARLISITEPLPGTLGTPLRDLIRHQVNAAPYWFQKIEVVPGLFSPAWSDPAKDKLPYFGLPEDLTGMRVLDIGCAEGFFSFEAERFYGVLYHLKHPQLALERIRSICTGQIRFQTFIQEEPAVQGTPWARYFPHGMMSGGNQELFDPTVFWLFNRACPVLLVRALTLVGAPRSCARAQPPLCAATPRPFPIRRSSAPCPGSPLEASRCLHPAP